MIYYLGVDGGGTSTNFKLYNNEGQLMEEISLPSIHFMKATQEEMITTLKQSYDHFKKLNYEPSNFKVVLGLGGYGANPDIRKIIEEATYEVYPQATLMNDAQLALISALNNEDGIFVISGTGSIALYQSEGQQTRSGGFGYLIGDEGSAFWIGKKIIERFTKESDNRIPQTELTPAILQYFKLDNPQQLIQVIANSKDNYRALLAELSGAMHNIESVQDIYKQAGIELAELANSFKTINNETPVAFGGSVLLKNQTVKQTAINHLNDNLVYTESNNEPEYTAYLINQTQSTNK